MSNNPNGTDGPKVKIKASCFDCRHCKSTGYAVQGDSGHAVSCSLVDKRIGDTTWDTPTWCPLLAAAVDAANGTCDARAEIARLTAELAAARAEVDCGQDGPCAKAPGCARHWQERNRELVAELAAARAVTAGVCRYLDCAASDLLAVVTSLYETRARAISDATAAHGTVGGLLATAPVGSIVEYMDADGSAWHQVEFNATMTAHRLRIASWGSWKQRDMPQRELRQPARLVPADQADLDPATRGPLPKGG